MLLLSQGMPTFSDDYLPYGQDNGSPPGTETYRYTGIPVSQTTGLYYDYQRWYDPSVGRFISQNPDPGRLSDPQTLNPYVYVTNTPTTLTDPTGMHDDYGPCTWTSGWVPVSKTQSRVVLNGTAD